MAFNQGHPTAGTYITTHAVTKPTHDGILIGALAYETDTGDTYIYDGATWSLYAGASGGSGDIVGPAAAVANAIALFDGTTGKLLKDSTVVLATGMGAALATALNGSGALVGTTGAVMIGPALGAATYTSLAGGTQVITSAAASAWAIGPNGDTNPVVRVVANVANQATGVSITGAASGSGVTIAALGGTNENITLAPKGNGRVIVGTDPASTSYIFSAAQGGSYIRVGTSAGAQIGGGVNGFQAWCNFGTGATSDPIASFYNSAGAEKARFTSNGFLSIGHGAVTYCLHIAPTSGATIDQTFLCIDNTSSTGSTQGVFKAGAAQSTKPILTVHDGTNPIHQFCSARIGLFGVTPAVRTAAWTITNDTADRTFDANSTSIDELADCLATLIKDFQTYGLTQ